MWIIININYGKCNGIKKIAFIHKTTNKLAGILKGVQLQISKFAILDQKSALPVKNARSPKKCSTRAKIFLIITNKWQKLTGETSQKETVKTKSRKQIWADRDSKGIKIITGIAHDQISAKKRVKSTFCTVQCLPVDKHSESGDRR